jgi:integrase
LHEGQRPAREQLANNSIRSRAARLAAYLSWCTRRHIDVADLSDELAAIRRSYPRTYGKVQAHNPAQFLNYEQAYRQLLAACQDGTWTGERDQLAIRLGLSGMRANEIVNLRWRNLQPGRIAWTGKGNKPRRISIGPNLADHLGRWRCHYVTQIAPASQLGQLPVIPASTPPGAGQPRRGINYTQPIGYQALLRIVVRRARQAKLGHVAPHDLRRSAAAILHHATTDDGGHRYDLLDIQRVLGHSDPATTMRSYLEPLDTAVLDRAAATLD